MYNMVPIRNSHNVSARSNYYNPFSDDFFRAFFGDDFAAGMLSAERPLKVDIRDDGDHYLMEADMPGVSRENVHVDVDNGVMTISAEVNDVNESKQDGRYVYRERRYGRASRSFGLEGIREEDITAEIKDGVLKVTLPKRDTQVNTSARSIEIQ